MDTHTHMQWDGTESRETCVVVHSGVKESGNARMHEQERLRVPQRFELAVWASYCQTALRVSCAALWPSRGASLEDARYRHDALHVWGTGMMLVGVNLAMLLVSKQGPSAFVPLGIGSVPPTRMQLGSTIFVQWSGRAP